MEDKSAACKEHANSTGGLQIK